MFRIQSNTDTGTDLRAAGTEGYWLLQVLDQFLGDCHRVCGIRQPSGAGYKFITADTAGQVGFAQCAGDAVGHGFEDGIAGFVAVFAFTGLKPSRSIKKTAS